ncbi:serine hydrolase [Candidatus Magnetaquicoccus inordinatus]|uniref:serine hydrolase n=1 Tax=Candidatus Magnetaquicoccus inordinatus TaxID=2496818 RepID=UPI00102C39F1|nr:serine hydrolase [Candidatus Magnetaquicoccus inordinatus]
MNAVGSLRRPLSRWFVCGSLSGLLASGLFWLGVAFAESAQELPPKAAAASQWAPLQQAMEKALQSRGYHGGVLVLHKEGRMVFAQGFGWADRAKKVPMPSTALLRIGSIAKPLTQALLKSLQRQGRLRLSDYAFCFPENKQQRCWLTIPEQWQVESGWSAVTLQHLLNHQGGLPSRHEDPALIELRVAQQLAVPSPPSRMDLLRYTFRKAPQPAVGTVKAYSNLGYEILGMVAEQAGGKSYWELLQEHIFAPLRVAAEEVQPARSLPKDRHPREPEYIDHNLVPSLFAPRQRVFAPDGGYNEENLLAAGGLIASAQAIAQFMNGYWLGSGEPRHAGEVGQFWQMEGVQRGMHALAEQWTQQGQDFHFVALFNGYDAARSAALYGELEEGIRQVYRLPKEGSDQSQLRVESERLPQVVAQLNRLRSSGKGCSGQVVQASRPLQWQESLANAAEQHAKEQVLKSRPGLLSGDGSDLFSRWRQQGYRPIGGYEYLLWVEGEVSEAVSHWITETKLCQTLLRPGLADVGVAAASIWDKLGRKMGKRLLVLDLGVPEP